MVSSEQGPIVAHEGKEPSPDGGSSSSSSSSSSKASLRPPPIKTLNLKMSPLQQQYPPMKADIEAKKEEEDMDAPSSYDDAKERQTCNDRSHRGPHGTTTATTTTGGSSTSPDYKPLEISQLLLATVISLGVQLDWSVQAALLTPFLLVVGVPYKYYTLACLCGPISGLIVQPLMGVFSDHCHARLGRRRPFIIAGVLLIVLGLMLIANYSYIGMTFWGAKTSRAREGGMVTAIMGLWIVDMANNALAGPCRALIADIAPPEQQRLGNSLMAVWSSIGSVIGFMICAVPWTRFFPGIESEHCKLQCADVRVVTSICAIVLLVTATLTVLCTKEKPLVRWSDDAPDGPIGGTAMVGKLFHMLFHMPPALARICAFQFFAWSAWFYHSLFIAVWVGKTVNQGDGAALVGSELYLRYESGIKAASLGLVLFAILTGLSSMALPAVLHRFKTRRTLAAAQIMLCLCYLSTFLIPRGRIYVAASVIMLFALPWSVFIVVPFAITAQMAPPDQRGLYLGSLNIFAVLPQILVSLSGPVFAHIFGDQDATQAAFGFSAMLALASLAVVPFIITKVKVVPGIKPPGAGALEAPVLQEVEPVEALDEEEEEGIIENLVETPLLRLYNQYSSTHSIGRQHHQQQQQQQQQQPHHARGFDCDG